MSITVYVDNHFDQPSKEEKVWLTDLYPFMTEEYFAMHINDGYTKYDESEKRHYEIKTVIENEFPTVSIGQSKANVIMSLLGLNSTSGSLCKKEIPRLKRACMMLMNTSQTLMNSEIHETRTYAKRNPGDSVVPLKPFPKMIDMGVSVEQMKRTISELFDVLNFAQAKDKGIYWG